MISKGTKVRIASANCPSRWISGLGSADLERMGPCPAPRFFCLALFDPYRSGRAGVLVGFGFHSCSRGLIRPRKTSLFLGQPTALQLFGTSQPALEHRDIQLITDPANHENFPAMGPYQGFVEGIVGVRAAELGYSRH